MAFIAEKIITNGLPNNLKELGPKIDVPFYSTPNFVNRCRGCNNNLNGNDPASRYQKLKLIQNTVRVPSSIYTMNLGALNVYEKPNTSFQTVALNGAEYIVSPGVNWNQMSDRGNPHVQKVVSGSGSTYGGNSLKRTLTRLRPGALSPGGYGVDIKHNSYDRYLARIKGKAPLRRGFIPQTFASSYLPFNPAFPVYGGKLFKTSIVSRCDCPIESNDQAVNELLYESDVGQDKILNENYTFNVGDIVFVQKFQDNPTFYQAVVLKIEGINLVVKFVDDLSIITVERTRVKISLYNKCKKNICSPLYNDVLPFYQFKYIAFNGLKSCTVENALPTIYKSKFPIEIIDLLIKQDLISDFS